MDPTAASSFGLWPLASSTSGSTGPLLFLMLFRFDMLTVVAEASSSGGLARVDKDTERKVSCR